jgi:hypothetical protein
VHAHAVEHAIERFGDERAIVDVLVGQRRHERARGQRL